MRVLVTGMIAGMDDADYLRRVVALGQRNNREIKVYNAVDDFTKAGKKPFERLLGTTDYVFELTREKEYEKIGYEIQRNNYQDVIIRAPATWSGTESTANSRINGFCAISSNPT